eukprot:gene11952-5353_t
MSIALKIIKQYKNDYFIQGEKLTGHIYLEIENPLKNIHAVILVLRGIEQVKLNKSLLHLINPKLSQTSENIFLEHIYIPWKSKKKYNQMNPGIYKFPYQITFPEEPLPSTIQTQNFNLKYFFQCILITSDHHFFHYETLKEVRTLPNLIENSLEICVCGCELRRDEVQGYLSKKKNRIKNVISKNISFIFKFGKMVITLISNRYVYFDGEVMDISMIVSNGTVVKTKGFSIDLIQKDVSHDEDFNVVNTDLSVLDSQRFEEIIDSNVRYEKRINVNIPKKILESTLITELTIQRQYYLHLKLNVENLPLNGEKAEILLPIEIIRAPSCSIKPNIFIQDDIKNELSHDEEGFEMVEDNVDFLDEKIENMKSKIEKVIETDELGSSESYSSFDEFMLSNYVITSEDESNFFYDYQGEMNDDELVDLKPYKWRNLWQGK